VSLIIAANYGDCATCWTNNEAPPYESAEGVTRVLQEFNAFNDGGTSQGVLDKKRILDRWLEKIGLPPIPDYNESAAADNRDRILAGVPQTTGVLLN